MAGHVNGTCAPVIPKVGDEEDGVGQLVANLKEKGTNFVLLKKTPQILELQTILKDRYEVWLGIDWSLKHFMGENLKKGAENSYFQALFPDFAEKLTIFGIFAGKTCWF